MSNIAINTPAATDHPPDDGHGAHAHDPHLAHHFDTPEQQYASAKLGMWIFLGTEILMFGGLFCAYSVYRHNHPDVFAFAHHELNKWLGAINTIVLITSSLTMAWAVRSSQLGQSTALRWLLAVTILGGYIFLGVKSIEYHTKWHHDLFIGSHNKYRDEATKPPAVEPAKTETAAEPSLLNAANPLATLSLAPPDPNASGPDAAKNKPAFQTSPQRIVKSGPPVEEAEGSADELPKSDRDRLYTFFAVYFVMTGLHGLHVVIGMSLIMWVLLRALGPKHAAWAVPLIPGSVGLFLAVVGLIIREEAGTVLIIVGLIIAVLCVFWAALWVPRSRNRSGESEFGPTYFTPVDLVGLYWHLVDLIWIFLFPLLYLIH